MSISETFHGYIETTQDTLLVFEACRRNILPKIPQRLQDREKKLVRSGAVFVFDEKDSGIKRWTDGLIWSPSRILGNFLIYRELDKKKKEPLKRKKNEAMDDGGGGGGKIRARSNSTSSSTSNTAEATDSATTTTTFDQNTFQRNRERQLVGSLSESFNFKQNGLIKKTMSLVVNGSPLHLVSYYHPHDVLERQLRTPSVVPELANLEISPELLSRQNFRIPPMVEPSSDDTDLMRRYSSSSSFSNSSSKLFGDQNSTTGFTTTLPTPTQSTPNTPLPTSPLSHHHSISTPMKSRMSASSLYKSSGNTSFMDYYNAAGNSSSASGSTMLPRQGVTMSLSTSLFNSGSDNNNNINNNSNNTFQIPSMIPEETMEHDLGTNNNNNLLQ